MNQKLYKRRNDGKVNVWWAEISQHGSRYRTHHGINDGLSVTSDWTQAKAKRGYTPQEQAVREVKAMYRLKRNQGYTDNVSQVDKAKEAFFRPMLAHHFKDAQAIVIEAIKQDGHVFVQPKYDGMRCIATFDGMWSRKGKPIKSAPHILQALFSTPHAVDNAIFDGELYTHKFADDFNKIISLARKQQPTKEDLEESAKHLQYHIYDLPSFKESFDYRITDLTTWVKKLDHSSIKVAPTKVARSIEEIDAIYAKFRTQGYEGAIIRIDRPYENKRSKFLLKYKELHDEEFEIRGVYEGTGNRSGMCGYMRFETPGGAQFTAAVMGTDEDRRRYLKDRKRLIGVQATVQYQNMTPAGVPRFPCVKSIRDYE